MALTLVDGPTPVLEDLGRSLPTGGGSAWLLAFGDTQRPGALVTLRMSEVAPGQYRLTGADFQSTGKDELSVKWVSGFPLTRCVRDAALALEDALSAEPDDGLDLPAGYPTRANRHAWYPRFLDVVDGWERAGMRRMDCYREVARRKRVDPNRVKQWAHVAKQLQRERLAREGDKS